MARVTQLKTRAKSTATVYDEILQDPVFTPALKDQIARVEDHQDLTNQFVRKVIRGVHRHAILQGPPGLGKSYCVNSALREAGLREVEDYYIVKGHLTNSQLFALLYQYRQKGKFLVLDDCDDVLNNEIGMGVIKGATDPDSGLVCWHSPGGVAVNGEWIKQFHFRGTLIICSNISMSSGRPGRRTEHINAITSRVTQWPMRWSNREQKFAQVFNMVVNHDYLSVTAETTLTTDQKRDMLKFLLENLDDVANLDLRLPQKIAREIRAGGNWRRACRPFLGV